MSQRWQLRLPLFRDDGERIRTSEYEVAAIPDDTTARQFVELHHYSGSYPAARFRHGLYRRGDLVGVAVFSQPGNNATAAPWFGGRHTESVELGRFVLLDEVPGNGETWFLGRCFEMLRRPRALRGVLSFADPVPRLRGDGVLVMPGHIGTIYQAFNGVYAGRGTARTLRLLPDGTALNDRAVQKVRALEKGWTTAVERLQAFGAGPFDMDGRALWLAHWIGKLTRPLRHPGNHRYLWSFDRRLHAAGRALAPAGFPKSRDVVQH